MFENRKTDYIAPAIAIIRMAAEQIMVDLSYGDELGDGTQLSKMTAFGEPEETDATEAADYDEEATKLHVKFRDIWADE